MEFHAYTTGANRGIPENELLIPMFTKNGTALTLPERERLAQKKGICERCFAQRTYDIKNVFLKTALNNDNVYNGVCIRCYPDSVPTEILTAWDSRNASRNQTNRTRLKPAIPTAAVVNANPSFQSHRRTHSRNRSESHPLPAVLPDEADDSSTASGPNISSRVHHRSSHAPQRPTTTSSCSSTEQLFDERKPSASLHHSAPSSIPVCPPRPMASRPSNNEQIESERRHRALHVAPDPLPTAKDYNPQGSETNAWDIIKALRENRDNAALLRKNLHCLRNLAMDDQTGALYEIKDIMQSHMDDPLTLAVACGALWGITSLNDELKEEVQTSGTMDIIIDCLRRQRIREDVYFVEWALGTLACLARGFGNKRAIAEQAGIEYIIEAMNHHLYSIPVFEWGCRVLHSLVYQYENEGDDEYRENAATAIATNIYAIDESGGVVAIVKGMKTHSNEITAVSWAIKLLLRLQDRGDVASVAKISRKINDGDGINSCVDVLMSRVTTPDIFASTATLLAGVLSVCCPSDRSALKHALESIGPVVRAMKNNIGDEALQESCCSLLSILVANGKDSRKILDELEGCVTVAKVMKEHISNIFIQESACRLLWFMSVTPNVVFCGVDHALESISTSIKAHPASDGIRSAACGIIANLSLTESTSEFELPIEIPFETLSLNLSDGLTIEQASRAMINIATKYPEKLTSFLQGEKAINMLKNLSNASVSLSDTMCDVLLTVSCLSHRNKELLLSSGYLEIGVRLLKNADTCTPSAANRVLELISTLSENPIENIPIDIFPTIVHSIRKYRRDADLRELGCCAIRNLLVSTCMSTTLPVEGLMDEMIRIIESPMESVSLKKEACGVLWAMAAKRLHHASDDIIQMFKCVVNFMALYKGDENPYDSDLQSEAAGALAAITVCLQDTTYDPEPRIIDTIIAVMYMAMEYDLTRLELLEKILAVILNLSSINKNTVIHCGGIVVVIDAMVEHESEESIQETGCSILALLSSIENLQVSLCIAESDGIDMLVSALAVFPSNECIQMDACKALSHVSVDRESRSLISSQGGLILVVNAINNHKSNPDLVEAALSAMLNLSCSIEEQVLSDSNAVATVINVMNEHVGSDRVQEKSLGVLQNISMSNTFAKRLVGEEGGIAAVSKAVSEFMGSPNVVERAFTTLWSLAVLEQNQVLIEDAQSIPLVVNGMMANIDHVKVQKQACGCLCTLSSNSLNKKIIREAGGVDAIVFAMWYHFDSESLQVEACRSLSSLAVNVSTNEVMLASDGEVNAILAAMRRYPESSKLQEHACVALRNFMLSSDNAVLMRSKSEEIRKLMIRASNQFPDRCSERARQVLACLT